jgi:hypothetical protein
MMTNKHRKNIVREAKRDPRWTSNEGVQDTIIEEKCKERGFELCHFYCADGKMLNKLLDNE